MTGLKIEMYSRRGRGGRGFFRSNRGRGRVTNSWRRSDDSQPSSSSTEQQRSFPIMSGPRINRTWKRPMDQQQFPITDEEGIKGADRKLGTESAASNYVKNTEESTATGVVSDSSNDSTRSPIPEISSTSNMRKLGRNKLVVKNKPKKFLEKEFAATRADISESKMAESKLDFSHELKSRGYNQLVSESRLQEEERLKERLKRKRLESKRGKAPSGPAKRVKLLIVERDNSEGGDTENKTYPTEAPSQMVEKLSDYAYHQISNTRRGMQRKMGLVRIASKTEAPICPTFLRGMPCMNPKCKKRHDVPAEAATPICSFFQRNGQCLRRDTCPFRHIKVNPHAEICPSFSVLGYCEDPNCEMKHIRAPKK